MGLIRDYMRAAVNGVSAADFLRHVGTGSRLIESLDGDSFREELSSEQRATIEAAAVRNREARQADFRESAETWLQRHTVPVPSACFRPAPLQEAGDAGTLADFRRRHFTVPDMPAPRLALQEDTAGQRVTPAGDLQSFRRRHFVDR